MGLLVPGPVRVQRGRSRVVSVVALAAALKDRDPAMQYAGEYGSEEINRGLAYVMRYIPPQEQNVGHYFYGHYYAAQAMYLSGDENWQRFRLAKPTIQVLKIAIKHFSIVTLKQRL